MWGQGRFASWVCLVCLQGERGVSLQAKKSSANLHVRGHVRRNLLLLSFVFLHSLHACPTHLPFSAPAPRSHSNQTLGEGGYYVSYEPLPSAGGSAFGRHRFFCLKYTSESGDGSRRSVRCCCCCWCLRVVAMETAVPEGASSIPWMVNKFGGTSVANAEAMRAVKGIVMSQVER